MESVTLYSTHCPRCQVLEKKLTKAGIAYTVCDDITFMRAQGWNEAPMLEVNGKIMDFRNAVEWINQR